MNLFDDYRLLQVHKFATDGNPSTSESVRNLLYVVEPTSCLHQRGQNTLLDGDQCVIQFVNLAATLFAHTVDENSRIKPVHTCTVCTVQ